MKITILLSLMVLAFSVSGFGQSQTDFSGTWVFGQMVSSPDNKLKTALYKMRITQTSTDIKIATSLNNTTTATSQNSNEITYTFNQETPINIQSSNGKITGKVKASLKNNKLNLISSRNLQTANGELSQSINDIYELSDDDKSIRVKRDIRTTNGVPTFEIFIAEKVDSSVSVADNIYNIFDLPSIPKKDLTITLNAVAKKLTQPNTPGSLGWAEVVTIFDEGGKVIFARATKGGILLGNASVEAAMKSTFEPMKVDGKPVKVSGIIIYNFVR